MENKKKARGERSDACLIKTVKKRPNSTNSVATRKL